MMLADFSKHNYFSDPLCASWFEMHLEEGVDACPHQSCWAIMCIGDSMVSYWFKPNDAAKCDVKETILNEYRTCSSSAKAIAGFIDRLNVYRAEHPGEDFVKVIPAAISNFETMAKQYLAWADQLRELAGDLGIQPLP